MTTATLVTSARLALTPLFAVELALFTQTGREEHRWLALSLFIVAVATDGLDGFIARRWNQVSTAGATLDALADGVLLTLGVLILGIGAEATAPLIPVWASCGIVARQAVLLLGWSAIGLAYGDLAARSSPLGKASTVVLMALVLACLLNAPPAARASLCYLALPLGWLSALGYIRAAVRATARRRNRRAVQTVK